MSFLLTRKTRDWLRDQMGRGVGFGSRPRRIIHVAGSGGGSGDVVVCRVKDSNGREWSEGVDVDVYDNGFMEPPTGTGVLYLPEVGQFTKPRNGFAVLAHRGCVFAADSGADEPQTGEGDES